MKSNLFSRFTVLFLLATPLQAEDFMFTVPVNVSHLMKSVKEVLVTCQVYNEDEVLVGKGQRQVPVKDGGYQGDVAVAFDADPGMNPMDGLNYKCQLRLRNNTGYRYVMPGMREEMPELPVWAQAKPDSELMTELEGTLPGRGEPEGKDQKTPATR